MQFIYLNLPSPRKQRSSKVTVTCPLLIDKVTNMKLICYKILIGSKKLVQFLNTVAINLQKQNNHYHLLIKTILTKIKERQNLLQRQTPLLRGIQRSLLQLKGKINYILDVGNSRIEKRFGQSISKDANIKYKATLIKNFSTLKLCCL